MPFEYTCAIYLKSALYRKSAPEIRNYINNSVPNINLPIIIEKQGILLSWHKNPLPNDLEGESWQKGKGSVRI